MVRGLTALWCTRCSVKKLCTNVVKEGARVASGIARLRSLRGVSLEALGGHGHQIGDCVQIPISIRDRRMADIGGEGDHGMIDICAVPLPQLDAFADERMAKIVDARWGVATAGGPAELCAQLSKDPLYRRRGQSRA